MILYRHCEPLFARIAEVYRAVAIGQPVKADIVRANLVDTILALRGKADRDSVLARLWNKIEAPLVWFSDGMILALPRDSSNNFMGEWRPIAFEWTYLDQPPQNLVGDEAFIERLDNLLNSNDPDAPELMAVYYACLGMGYCGRFRGMPDQDQQINRRLTGLEGRLKQSRFGQYWLHDVGKKICEGPPCEAYYCDTRALPPPEATRYAFYVASFVFLSLVILACYTLVYYKSSDEIRGALKLILQSQR
ncbi:MAG: DotU family type IV/VI secretion system protein [Verrucomicrobiae bacterium]|nr:DotU family type IV/VI secretion system protein [Verrucomicrobiae bacterium]